MEDLEQNYVMTYNSINSEGYLNIINLTLKTMESYKNEFGVCVDISEPGYFDTVRVVSPEAENFQDPKSAVGPVRVGY